MVITINEKPADISLENEKSLKDVISGLDTWLKKEGFFMSNALLNGKALSLDETDLGDIKIENIERLDIFAHELQELVLENVGTLYQFLFLVKSNIAEKNAENIRELRTELPYILDTMDSILGVEKGVFSEKLKTLIDIGIGQDGVPMENTEELIQYLNTILLFLENIIREKTDPAGEFVKTVKALGLSLPNIREITVLLQTGKDKEAMELIIAFTELSSKVTRLFPLLEGVDTVRIPENVGEKPLRDFYTEMNGFLSELLEAFENEDSVLIGDLLEYEIAPRIEELVTAVNTTEKREEHT